MGDSRAKGSTGWQAYHSRPEPATTVSVVGRPALLAARPDLAAHWAQADALFPVRVTGSFWSRVDPSDRLDPLARQVLPSAEELDDPEGLDDPVGDAACSPLPWVVHKYPDRVLILLTKRCHLYCRYCFRRTFDPAEREDPTVEELDAAIAYARRSGAEEVILSGGDPLAVRDERLFDVIDALRPSVPVLRVHSRAPITKPARVTERLVRGLASRAPVWMVVHCNHPRELSPEVDEALRLLIRAGVPVMNQAVLLRGVNDDVEVLVELCRALVRRGVKPYYLHHPDRVRGAGHFALSPQEGLSLYHALRRRLSGLATPRYVIDPPDGRGKIDVERHLGSLDLSLA
ncbi:MAG: KamA family radical SAM protein [Deltaproteobacteria bacterium]|nr:MAG: KamA family radical SAM protein [Deltaproteobacteria bacterium]